MIAAGRRGPIARVSLRSPSGCGAWMCLRGEFSCETVRQIIELLRGPLCWRPVPLTCAKGSTVWRHRRRRYSGRT